MVLQGNGLKNNYSGSIFKAYILFSKCVCQDIFLLFLSEFLIQTLPFPWLDQLWSFPFPLILQAKMFLSCCTKGISLWSLSMLICCSLDNTAPQQWMVQATQALGDQMNQVQEGSNKLNITCLRTIPHIHLNNYSLLEQYNHWLEIFL